MTHPDSCALSPGRRPAGEGPGEVRGGSIRLTLTPTPYRPLWVQHGNIYTLIEDELDVPYVVRGLWGGEGSGRGNSRWRGIPDDPVRRPGA